MSLNDILTALGNNGIGVVCAAAMLWLSWFRETHTIPLMLRTFAEEMRKERADSKKQHDEELERLDRIDTRMDANAREHRHYLRDMAHQLGIQKAIEDERKRRDQSDKETAS